MITRPVRLNSVNLLCFILAEHHLQIFFQQVFLDAQNKKTCKKIKATSLIKTRYPMFFFCLAAKPEIISVEIDASGIIRLMAEIFQDTILANILVHSCQYIWVSGLNGNDILANILIFCNNIQTSSVMSFGVMWKSYTQSGFTKATFQVTEQRYRGWVGSITHFFWWSSIYNCHIWLTKLLRDNLFKSSASFF